MSSIKLNNNKIKLLINDDENKFIEFNPSDLQFALKVEQMYKSISEIKIENNVECLVDVCETIDEEIDNLFGEGKAKMIFDGQMDVYLYTQFIEALIPYVKEASEKRVAKYLNK